MSTITDALGIWVQSPRCTVSGNEVTIQMAGFTGIGIEAERTLIVNNEIVSLLDVVPIAPANPSFGIHLPSLSPESEVRDNVLIGAQDAIMVGDVGGSDRIAIVGNRIRRGDYGPPRAGILIVEARESEISGNIVRDCAYSIAVSSGDLCRITNNLVRDSERGVIVGSVVSSEVSHNTLDNIAGAGIYGLRLRRIQLSDNRLNACAHHDDFAAIQIVLVTETLSCHGCEVRHPGQSDDLKNVNVGAVSGIAVRGVRDVQISDCRIEIANPNIGIRRALLLIPAVVGNMTERSRAEVVGNIFSGESEPHLVEIREAGQPRVGHIQFSDNLCLHFRDPNVPDDATVLLYGERVTVTGNQVRAHTLGGKTLNTPYSFEFLRGYLSATGNITSGQWLNVPPSPFTLPQPVQDFNHIQVN